VLSRVDWVWGTGGDICLLAAIGRLQTYFTGDLESPFHVQVVLVSNLEFQG
jgi:hypothetical protein